MQYNLLELLSSIKDTRRKEGKRHPLDSFVGMIIMAIISGHQGYRGFERFFNANKYELCMTFNLKHGLPSFGTIRTLIQLIDLDDLSKKFGLWMEKQYECIPKDDENDINWLSADGKSIRSTISGGNSSLQNFTQIVSIFAQKSKLTISAKEFENKKSHEPAILRDLIETLGLTEGIISLDAIHCQKKL